MMQTILRILYLLYSLRLLHATATIGLKIRKAPLTFFQTPLPFEFTQHTIATLEDQEGSRVIVDFVPADRSKSFSGLVNAILLLANQHRPGKVRCVKMMTTTAPSEELKKLIEEVIENWDDNINIYSHNCQDFTRYVSQRIGRIHSYAEDEDSRQ